MTTLEKIAKRNVSRLLETKSTFELLKWTLLNYMI